jgi:2-polyprenyl-6-methoxyphenol hydroxylase-like FAD-dependent oxidoreductase
MAWLAYLALFPIGTALRANMFVYRDMRDPWLREMRNEPVPTLSTALPGLAALIGDFEVRGPVKIRPVDLYVSTGLRRPGIVAIGDAFATSCPAAGTGVNKVLTDVERLCNAYIPDWLATPGMAAEKIAGFYEDPAKRASDDFSTAKAFRLKALSTERGLPWGARRWGRFAGHLGRGQMRKLAARLAPNTPSARQPALGEAPPAQ